MNVIKEKNRVKKCVRKKIRQNFLKMKINFKNRKKIKTIEK